MSADHPRAADAPTPHALVCGPTCGCGKSTPFVQTTCFLQSGPSTAWQSPEKCMHCGKQFGPAFYIADPSAATVARLTEERAAATTAPATEGTWSGRLRRVVKVNEAEAQVASLTEERDRLQSELSSWRQVARNEKAECERLTAALEAAKRDAERLDWLDAEHERVDPVARLVVKKGYHRNGGEWADVAESAREGIDSARAALPFAADSHPERAAIKAHMHRCMRCGQEFDCRTPSLCVAQYDVLPRIVTRDPVTGAIRIEDHCPLPSGDAPG